MSSIKKIVLLVAIFFLVGVAIAEQVYKTIDSTGEVYYSDVPLSKDSMLIDSRDEDGTFSVVGTQSQPTTNSNMPPLPQSKTVQGVPIAPQIPISYRINITTPADQETLDRDASVATVVGLTVTPLLHERDTLQLLLDGKVVSTQGGQPQDPSQTVPRNIQVLSFTLPYLERGAHTIQAKVVGADGRDKGASSIITVYQQRVSTLLGPQSNRPPRS